MCYHVRTDIGYKMNDLLAVDNYASWPSSYRSDTGNVTGMGKVHDRIFHRHEAGLTPGDLGEGSLGKTRPGGRGMRVFLKNN